MEPDMDDAERDHAIQTDNDHYDLLDHEIEQRLHEERAHDRITEGERPVGMGGKNR